MTQKLFYFSPDLPLNGFDGGSAHTLGNIKGFKKNNFSGVVIAKHLHGDKFFEKKHETGFAVLRLPMFGPGILKALLYNVYSLASFFLLVLVRADLVFERSRIFGGILTFLASKLYKKTVFEMNEPLLEAATINNKIKKNSFAFDFLSFFFNLAVEHATLVTITHECFFKGNLKRNTVVIHYGADPEMFAPEKKDKEIIKYFGLNKNKTLFYSGSMREWHEIRKIIEAIELLVETDNQIKLLIAGKGKQFNDISELIESKNLSKNIFLLGRIPYNEMPKFVASSDVCFALFDKEYPLFVKFDYFYSPIKVHEYKSAGKPVIATSIGNLKKLVKPEINGLLLEHNSVKEIVSAVQKLIEDRDLYKKISENNRKEVLIEYNWGKVVKKILHEINIRTGREYKYLSYTGKLKKSIIIPAFNEAHGIRETIQRCKKVCVPGDEIIVVDDGSTDNTSKIARECNVKVIKHKKNMGKKTALLTGFKKAKNSAVITIDADCTYPPEAIPEMMHELEDADIVVGTRFRHLWPKEMPFHRVFANKLGAFITSLILGETITDVTTGLRAFRKDILTKMPEIKAKGLDFEAELTSRAITNKLKYKEVKIIAGERKGNSTLNFFRHLWLFFIAVLRGKFF